MVKPIHVFADADAARYFYFVKPMNSINVFQSEEKRFYTSATMQACPCFAARSKPYRGQTYTFARDSLLRPERQRNVCRGSVVDKRFQNENGSDNATSIRIPRADFCRKATDCCCIRQ
jgi:hypothetical protein